LKRKSAASHWQPDRRAQSAERSGVEQDVAALAAGEIARDCQSKSDTADLQIAAFVQTMEGAKRFLALGECLQESRDLL
jgi:hypothetical protein